MKTLSGLELVVPYGPASGSQTVARLKELVAAQDGSAPHTQRLLFGGRALDATATMKECGIKPGDTVHAVLPVPPLCTTVCCML